jgi:hypothetical protein
MTFHVPEQFRVKTGPMQSNKSDGNNGQFSIIRLKLKIILHCQASDGYGWEHVSVSTNTRCPHWDEMCIIKDLFWDEEDCVVQYHPPASKYINNHPYVLHMWRPIDQEIIIPPSYLV